MPRFRREKNRSRSLETAMLLWSVWRWLPSGQKRRALLLARRHGPWILSTAFRRRRR